MRLFTCLGLILGFTACLAQKVAVTPTINPSVFGPNDQITVTYDVTGTSLATLSQAWIWVWIPNKSVSTKYNINPATSAADPAKFTKAVANGKTTWSLTFKPADFFSSSISSEKELGMLIKASDWPQGQSTDFIAPMGFQISIQSPLSTLVFGEPGSPLNFQATSPTSADFMLYLNETIVTTQANTQSFSYIITLPSTPTTGTLRLSATPSSGGNTSNTTFDYVLGSNSPTATRPNGIRPGITYGPISSSVTLCLQAPGKSSVYAYGDFSDWQIRPEYLMARDGEYFWITLNGLTPGQEYGFQYLVDGALRMADPYADKILDPDDRLIPASSFPGLKSFPSKALQSKWYFNRVSVFQTNQVPYAWGDGGYQRPAKEALVIYELLIRDFFGPNARTYQSVIDTLSYLKRLGVNALQLMPIMEFNGNESWGYNPAFMLAPDKYYGPKDKLKELIDRAHQAGMAVILDIALNHQDLPNPMVMMDFDFVNMKPTAANRWFNTDARHPFNVFYDMNHESTYTKAYLDTITRYWIEQYHVDGYRFDLSKGFTQTNNPENVAAWGEFDASRVALLKRMADDIWQHAPDAYVILEHLGVNSEEKALADHRSAEGKGMMLWGKMTEPYNETTMGYGGNASVAQVLHSVRGFQAPRLIGYMESHDEERLMYKNLAFGNQNASHSVKDLNTALLRMKSVSNFFLLLPGPKMLWQFGELGFEYSINRCEDGTVNPPGAEGGSGDCRLSNKPPVWEYRDDYYRRGLFDHTADLIRLKRLFPLFQNGSANFVSDGLTKQVVIRSPNPSNSPTDPTQMNAVLIGNFELEREEISVAFPHTGTWYEYYSGNPVSVSGSLNLLLEPGTVRMYTDVPISNPIITALKPGKDDRIRAWPNPAHNAIELSESADGLFFTTVTGQTISVQKGDGRTWDIRHLPSGAYIGRALVKGAWRTFRMVKP